jgi:hypothetical protein
MHITSSVKMTSLNNLKSVIGSNILLLSYIALELRYKDKLLDLRFSRSRDSDWLRAGRPRGRSTSSGRVKNFLFSTSSRPALGSTQPPIQWVAEALSSAVKWPGREAVHSPPASAEPKIIWIYISIPPYAFMA